MKPPIDLSACILHRRMTLSPAWLIFHIHVTVKNLTVSSTNTKCSPLEISHIPTLVATLQRCSLQQIFLLVHNILMVHGKNMVSHNLYIASYLYDSTRA